MVQEANAVTHLKQGLSKQTALQTQELITVSRILLPFSQYLPSVMFYTMDSSL